MYNHTRHMALERLEKEAAERGANAVVDIQTQIIPFGVGTREMLMVGTASYNPVLGKLSRPVTLSSVLFCRVSCVRGPGGPLPP